MKKGKSILVTGMVVAAVMVAGVSVYAASDVVEDTTESVKEKGGIGRHSQRGRGSRDYSYAVEAGILTQDEADEIMAYLEEHQLDKETIKEAVDGLTKEEAKTYMEENYPRVDLVEEGLISEAQSEELKALIPEKSEEGRADKNGGRRRGTSARTFEAAVEAGILSQDEADVIAAYCEENKIDKEDLEDELEGLSKEEARAYMQENYPRSEDPIGDLVEAGLLTEDQGDEIEALREEASTSKASMKSTGIRGISR